MVVTEEEAKTKWCPEARPPVDRGVYCDPKLADNRCIGSACMAWRWQDSASIEEGEKPSASSLGYCGKAGRP